ncbi:CPBP family intramembrane metalloprotease [Clostridiaceae bacterium M8S5]|nr:CPBP family intramembrane metalloprotease [Clostridiaceae bacterium M8S5]
MKENFIMKLNENLLWLSVLILSILSYFYDYKYIVVLIFWIIIIFSVGNAKRFYSKRYIKVSTIVRRSIYVIPFILPLAVDFKISIKAPNLIYWCILGVCIGMSFIIPKLNQWRLILSKYMIEFTPKRHKVEYITHIYMLFGAAVGEELFFRNFVIGYIDNSSEFFLIILSCFMFLLNHLGVKWNQQFKKQDYINQIIFGGLSSILFVLSKSVIPCIIAHLVFNTPLMILAFKNYCYHYKKSNLRIKMGK